MIPNYIYGKTWPCVQRYFVLWVYITSSFLKWPLQTTYFPICVRKRAAKRNMLREKNKKDLPPNLLYFLMTQQNVTKFALFSHDLTKCYQTRKLLCRNVAAILDCTQEVAVGITTFPTCHVVLLEITNGSCDSNHVTPVTSRS